MVQHPLHIFVVGNGPGQISRRPPEALPLLSGGMFEHSGVIRHKDSAQGAVLDCKQVIRLSIVSRSNAALHTLQARTSSPVQIQVMAAAINVVPLPLGLPIAQALQ